METPVDPYEDVALVYARLVRRESQEAANAVEQIHAQFGSRAALRAALIITIFIEEIQHHHLIPDIRMYIYLFKDYEDAIPVLRDAITRYLESERMPERDKRGWQKWQRILDDQHSGVGNQYADLVQRVRQLSPITAVKLEQIYENHGITAGDYAAAAVIWLQARIDLYGSRILMDVNDQTVREFTYFQYMSKNVEALDRFTEMLKCYRMEHRPESISISKVTSDLTR